MNYNALICSRSTRQLFISKYGQCFGDIICIKYPPTQETICDLGKYDFVAAIGGGAVIDAAKIVGNIVHCWPTTASGASATSHSVYWKGEEKCNCYRSSPDRVMWEEVFINSLPENIYQRTKYDAISHCLDSMWSKDCTDEIRALATETLEVLLKPDVDRMSVMKSGHTAGYIIEKVPTTILHALSYPMTGIYNIPHGAALGILLKPVCTIMGELEIANLIEEPKYNYFYDVDNVVESAKTYKKFHNTYLNINTRKLKALINGRSNS
jgi:alcohol dehydrogenase class IV